MKTSNYIRKSFLDFFKSKQHEIVPSSSLVPVNDPTLLFTNAGMVQFKDLFLGREKRNYKRAVSSQRCIRAGGKHNDLENVGYTARHHTFFEMLGNFSFGDYFKREAILYAWEYLTEVLNIPEDRLWITVFEKDDEAASIWLDEVGISPSSFSRCGEKDNFWSMGDTGPCGPCSEIYYDHGKDIKGDPPGLVGEDSDRYIEIWNLVFTQYDRGIDGVLRPIPHPSVDTGMGLERITAIMQGVHSNYDIDIFKSLINEIKLLADSSQLDTVSCQVVADHVRSSAFLIIDGVLPSNDGRGYVLRRIIRRAIRHGNKLGFNRPFFYKIVKKLNQVMGDAYPEFADSIPHIEQVLLAEEERFAETLEQGLKVLEDIVSKLNGRVMSGNDIFRLYDTYGFPVDLTGDIARERNFKIDMDGFHKAMAKQRQKARSASKFDVNIPISTENNLISLFTGYKNSKQKTEVIALYQDGGGVQSLQQGDVGGVILSETPFYANSGGQIGDNGELFADNIFFEVEDTKKQGEHHIHLGVLRVGELKVGDVINAVIDEPRRKNITRNHSATHLLHSALKKSLGANVIQKGSLVSDDKLRFDFSYDKSLTKEELQEIEHIVNVQILLNNKTHTQNLPLEKAKLMGAMSLFGEKYADIVRVVNIGSDFSCELCGGTHVSHAGDIGLFKIISESGVALGVRRIEAITGLGLLTYLNNIENKLLNISKELKTDIETADLKLSAYLQKSRKIEKELEQLKIKFASNISLDMVNEAEVIGGIKVLAKTIEGVDPKALRDTIDKLKNKLGSAAIVIATVKDSKVSLVAGVTKNNTDLIKAVDLVNFVAKQVGGKGGGRADMAQAGGGEPVGLDLALSKVYSWVRDRVIG